MFTVLQWAVKKKKTLHFVYYKILPSKNDL